MLDSAGNELEFRGWIYRDLLRPIAEVDAMGNVVARYVYADGDGARENGVSQLATRLGANQDTSLPFRASNVPELIELLSSSGAVTERLRLIANQVGMVEAVVDAASGAIVERLEYDEFGRVLFDSNPSLQPFGFGGGIFEPETKLVRFGARDYDSTVGRWIARDAIRERGGLNSYVYADGDPINRSDPTGFASTLKEIFDAIKLWLGITNGLACNDATNAVQKARDRCEDAQKECWGPGSTIESCADFCEQTGFSPTSPSDDRSQCLLKSPEWKAYLAACQTTVWDFL